MTTGLTSGMVTVMTAGASSTPRWNLDEVSGRLVELSGTGANCAMSYALLLVHDAQMRGEPVAWVTTMERTFHPPDAAAMGVDLDALIVVRASDMRAVAGAADRLIRSGALGLCILDFQCEHGRIPMAIPSRMAGLARHHEAAVVCLTEKSAEMASLGPLVSLRLQASRGTIDEDGEARCRLDVVKDRQRGGRWTCEEVFRAPDGLR